MNEYVLLADGAERRNESRLTQFVLERRPVRIARQLGEACELLPGARLVVLGEFHGTAAPAYELLSDIRGGRILGVNIDLRAIATADGDLQILRAFAAGADLTLPGNASPAVVSASVAALIGRTDPVGIEEVVKVGGLTIDPAGREVTLHGQPVQLSKRELQLVSLLAKAPGRVFTREEIALEVWGTHIGSSRALDTHLCRAAQKFQAVSGERLITNVWGQGYKLTVTPEKGMEL